MLQISFAEYSFLMAKALAQGTSLVVLEEPGSSEEEPEIVGGMILPVLSIEDPELPEVNTYGRRTGSGNSTISETHIQAAVRCAQPGSGSSAR